MTSSGVDPVGLELAASDLAVSQLAAPDLAASQLAASDLGAPELVGSGPDQESASEGSREKLERIKDLYLTVEAIGDNNVGKHFDELMQRQRELISDYFKEIGIGGGKSRAAQPDPRRQNLRPRPARRRPGRPHPRVRAQRSRAPLGPRLARRWPWRQPQASGASASASGARKSGLTPCGRFMIARSTPASR